MNLDYAVERLYETGWHPADGDDLQTLSDGLRFPTVASVQRTFANLGLLLEIRHNSKFNCHRATWCPIGETIDSDHDGDESHGTVVGSCEREAAVYALAQLLRARSGAGVAIT